MRGTARASGEARDTATAAIQRGFTRLGLSSRGYEGRPDPVYRCDGAGARALGRRAGRARRRAAGGLLAIGCAPDLGAAEGVDGSGGAAGPAAFQGPGRPGRDGNAGRPYHLRPADAGWYRKGLRRPGRRGERRDSLTAAQTLGFGGVFTCGYLWSKTRLRCARR